MKLDPQRKIKILFRLFVVLFPIVLLLLVELSLRLLNLFPQPPLFNTIEKDGQQLYQINSSVGERYFNKKTTPVPNLYPQTFEVQKPANTFRIFCLGGSTTAGFPFEKTVPFPQQLSFLLNQDHPDKNIEVINLGLSAINSYTVLDWIPDILDKEPDLILIYMGHNEYYGAYGSASQISFGSSAGTVQFILKLQKLQLVQLFRSLIRGGDTVEPIDNHPTLMETIANRASIPVASSQRNRTYANFASNLGEILEQVREAGVPVILSDLVSNLRDQQPLCTTGSVSSEIKENNAFEQGVNYLMAGDTSRAYNAFKQARDHDCIPFRADQPINEIIREQASISGIPLVEMQATFRKEATATIPGNELFCDHLHPNPRGYHLMARQFRQSIYENDLLPAPESPDESPSRPLWVTNLDEEIGKLRVYALSHRWPFDNRIVDYSKYKSNQDGRVVKTAQEFLFGHHNWNRAHGEMGQYFQSLGEYHLAYKEYLAIIAMIPDNVPAHNALIECARQAKDWPMVEQSCKRALPLFDQRGMILYNLALSQRMLGQMGPAMQNILEAMKAPELNLEQAVNIRYTYALFLLDLRDAQEAQKVLRSIVEQAPDFLPAVRLLRSFEPAGES